MKFNEGLYELTKIARENKDEKPLEMNIEELKLENEILKIFCERAKEIKFETGLITVAFVDRFWGKMDEGYYEIQELLEKFGPVFRHYNIYLGDHSFLQDECHDSYFELIWDYKSYMENLNNPNMKRQISDYETLKARCECEKNGHDFSDWIYYKDEEGPSNSLPGGEYDDYNPYWKRKCNRCGFEEISKSDPEEYLKEISECESEIERLQNRLRLLKSRK